MEYGYMYDGTPVLHTNSIYANKMSVSIKDMKRKESIGKGIRKTQLLNKEQQLYIKFGAKSYSGFKTKIQELLGINIESENLDVEVLKRFSAENLKSYLDRYSSYKNGIEIEQEYKYIFNFDKASKINLSKEFKDELEKIGTVNLMDKTISLKLNTSTTKKIKEILKKYENRKFKEDSKDKRALKKYLLELNKIDSKFIEIIQEGVEIGSGNDNSNQNEIIAKYNIVAPNFPWSMTKKFMEEFQLLYGKEELNKALRDASNVINSFIEELSKGASKQLLDAIETVKKQMVPDGVYIATIFKGNTSQNFKSAVQGIFGEFQAAVIFEYVKNKAKKLNNQDNISNIEDIKAQVQGTERSEKGEQIKADVSLFEGMGIQIKNYTSSLDLETNIHPDTFSGILEENGAQKFLFFLANYFFNKTYQNQKADLFSNVAKILVERDILFLMSFLKEDEKADAVTFYLINGEYFVPASQIMEWASKMSEAPSEIITSKYNGKDDEEWKENFTDFWVKKENRWLLGKKNKTESKNLIGKDISLRKHFHISPSDLAKYSLFKKDKS